MKKYIRFGRIPKDEISKAHRGDGIFWSEKGVSVYNSVIVNDVYFPILPPHPSESAYADYFYFLFSDKRVFIVTGDELIEKGSSGEPLLKNVEILEEITNDYEYLKSILTRNRNKTESENKEMDEIDFIQPKKIVGKLISTDVFDKIKAEIEQNVYPIVYGVNNHEKGMTLYGILQIINKYKMESEGEE